jgi:hypothetical protein
VIAPAALTLLLAGGPGPTQPSAAGFYLGRLTSGARTLEVGLELRAEGGALSGEYYYLPAGGPIALRGTLGAANAFDLQEGPEGKPTGRWHGRASADTLTGTWQGTTPGRKWSFTLVRSEHAADYFAGPAVTKNAGSTGPIAYRMIRIPGSDKYSEHQVPLVTGFGNPALMGAINARMVGLARAAHCEEPPDDYELEAEVSFVGEDVLGIRAVESWFCHAAYPTSGSDASMAFDLRTGELLTLDDIQSDGARGKQLDEILFAYQWSQARAATEAPSPGGEDDFDCLDTFRDEAGFGRGDLKYHFAADGLVVREEYAHVIAYCTEDVTVPYAALAPVARPGSALARLAAADTRRPIRYRIHTRDGTDVEYIPPAR